MMLPTHAVVGLALAAPLSVLAPEVAPAALAGAFSGSVLPDLDMYAGHRRTLHFPTLYAVAAVPLVVVAAWLSAPPAVAVAALFVGAAVHCRMDRYGGGLELEPWRGTSERAVYDHARERWYRPKRWIAYDGSPGDAVLAVAVGLPLLFALDGPFRWIAAAALAVGLAYAALRRRLAALAPTVFGAVPEPLEPHVPERYRE